MPGTADPPKLFLMWVVHNLAQKLVRKVQKKEESNFLVLADRKLFFLSESNLIRRGVYHIHGFPLVENVSDEDLDIIRSGEDTLDILLFEAIRGHFSSRKFRKPIILNNVQFGNPDNVLGDIDCYFFDRDVNSSVWIEFCTHTDMKSIAGHIGNKLREALTASSDGSRIFVRVFKEERTSGKSSSEKLKHAYLEQLKKSINTLTTVLQLKNAGFKYDPNKGLFVKDWDVSSVLYISLFPSGYPEKWFVETGDGRKMKIRIFNIIETYPTGSRSLEENLKRLLSNKTRSLGDVLLQRWKDLCKILDSIT